MMDTKVNNKYRKGFEKSTLLYDFFLFPDTYCKELLQMKKSLNRKLVVRITENQYRRLQQNILEDKVSMSQVIREALRNKLNKIEIDDTWKRKFRV